MRKFNISYPQEGGELPMNDESNYDAWDEYDDKRSSESSSERSSDSYAELIAIIDAAIVDYGLTVTAIVNALNAYVDWCDMTGETDLDRVLFDQNLQPLLPSDIKYYQHIKQLYMNGDNYDE